MNVTLQYLFKELQTSSKDVSQVHDVPSSDSRVPIRSDACSQIRTEGAAVMGFLKCVCTSAKEKCTQTFTVLQIRCVWAV